MLNLKNGETKKIVLFDTNCLSQIMNFNNIFIRNLLEKFNPKEYSYALTFYNVIELSKRDEKYKKKMEDFLSKLPLILFNDISDVIKMENKSWNIKANDIVFTSLCDLEGFNTKLKDYFDFVKLNNNSGFFDRLDKVALSWMKERKNKNKYWQNAFRKNLIQEMNSCARQYYTNLSISVLNKYKSLEVQAYIKNEFITKTTQNIGRNSVIDSFNASYTPYVDVFITEKFVGSLLQQAKNKFKYLTLDICKISDLM